MDFEQLLVRRFEHWKLYLHKQQAYLGRCYLVISDEREGDPFLDCTPEEWSSLLYIVQQRIYPALKRLWEPVLFNTANFRNEWPACHWHIIPRYEHREVEFAGKTFTDANPGHNYAPYPNRDFGQETLFTIRDALSDEIG